VVPTWETHGSGGTDYTFATAMKEEPGKNPTEQLEIFQEVLHYLKVGIT
jgi:hypothetical protein